MRDIDVLINKIVDIQNRMRVLEASLSTGQQSYDSTVVPANYSHMHKPSSLLSGNLSAAINFTTRPTYDGADLLADGDPIGIYADDDATRMGDDADTARNTSTKVFVVQQVSPTGKTPEIANMGMDDIALSTQALRVAAALYSYDGTNLDVVRNMQGGATTRAIQVGLTDGILFVDIKTAVSTTSPNLDGLNLLGTHTLFSARKDATTTIGLTATDGTYNPLHVRQTDGEELQTTGKYAVTMEIENIVASQDFILIDKSDTTNFPHASSTGIVNITILDVEIDPDTSFVGDIELGFLENVDGTDGDYYVIKEWHMEKRADLIEDFVSLIGDPFKCSSTYHLTNAISLNDIAFQTDVALSSPFDDDGTGPGFTTVSGDGDIALRITMSAGSADLSIEIKYYVV